ncbi:MAG TPA: SsgA family sporulation/cell division regulator [Streptomyces sp.]|nr:SsgA family sporulation/cell division regulator [Streptomyces sp.]
MNPVVHKTLVAQLQAGETDRFPVLAHLTYDASDPLAVTAVFSHDGRVLAEWRLDRAMLHEGLRRPVGEGDVRLRPVSCGVWEEVCMELYGSTHADGGRQHALVFWWAPALAGFLRRTHDIVRPGREKVQVDDFLADLLAGS